MIYVKYGIDESKLWWSLDKINDRLFAFNLLFITSFIFRDATYRLFAIASMFYIVFYCYYELCFINSWHDIKS